MSAQTDYAHLRIWRSIWIASLTRDAEALNAAEAAHGLWHAQNCTDPEHLAAVAQRLKDIIATTPDDDKRAALARLRKALDQPCMPPAPDRPVRIRKRKAMA